MTRAQTAHLAAIVLAVATLAAGVQWGSTVGGGADSYGYVSQAGLWLRGTLRIHEDIIRPSPWPLAASTWAPLGYLPASDTRDVIVPLYAPGFPILMALVQAIGGFCAAFVIVPLCGALTVWLTYRLADRFFAIPSVSLASAALIATSPVFLYQLMNPMSDVPATAAWALSIALALDGWLLASGVSSGVALLIRPNVGAVVLVLLAWVAGTSGRRAIRFAIGLAPFVLVVAAIDTTLYGAPWRSGYGSIGEIYALANVSTNARQFVVWTLETQTPFVVCAAAMFASPCFMPSARVTHARALAGGVILAVTGSYIFYTPFDAWWYLRFLLPMWPLLCIALASSIYMLAQRVRGGVTAFAVCAALLVANGVRVAADRFAFGIGHAEGRYVDVARFVSSRTEPSAVMISLQHSGTLRLYANRLTLRFDQLDPEWLDRAVMFLESNGHHPYVVLDDGEVEMFRKRFGSHGEVGRLDWRPMAQLAGSPIVIYDASAFARQVTDVEPLAIAASASRRTTWRCDVPPMWPPPVQIP